MTMSAVLQAAAADVGYRETGSNITKYWATWRPSWQGSPYCAAAVTDWLSRGGELDAFDGKPMFYVPYIENLAKAKGRWHVSPAVGDLVCYSFGMNEGVHIGIVEKVNATTIQTIEANTSPTGSGSQNNGGGVWRRVRTRAWGIRGYYRPDYKAAPKAPASALPSVGVKPSGPTSQQATPTNLAVDGDFGRLSIAALNRLTGRGSSYSWDKNARVLFQKWLKVDPDGIVGRNTIIALQKRVGATPDGDWGRNTTKALQRYLNAR